MRCSIDRVWAAQAVALAALLAVGAPPASAQQPKPARPAAARVRLTDVITAFLVDSGVRTRGLPWTTGSALPITWQSPGPVANPDQAARQKGLTLARIGSLTGTMGDSVALPMTITLVGTEAGLAQMALYFELSPITRKDGSGYFPTRQMVEDALRSQGATLQPVKCSRDTEGASNGNLIDAVKVPGKTASGLWWFWQSAQQQLSLALTLLYRRADMAQVECYTG